MSNSGSTKIGGIGTLSLLGVAFIILRLCHVIDWSWWWVLSPFWIPIGIVLFVFLIVGLIALLGR
jgi:phosphoglycerol transferase MdoB-like AlkP superfamily enzyme